MIPRNHSLSRQFLASAALDAHRWLSSALAVVALVSIAPTTASGQTTDHRTATTPGARMEPMAVLPEHSPLNPNVVARSGLYVQPFLPPAEGWGWGVIAEYGSLVEKNLNFPDSYLFDAELSRLRLQLRRDLSPRWFAAAEWGLAGAQAGFADRFFEDYHRLIKFTMEERDARPRDSYGDRLFVRNVGIARVREQRAILPADARVSMGVRAGNTTSLEPSSVLSQTVLSLTLPTAPARSVYARGVSTVSLLQTVRVSPAPRLVLETMGGVGYSPRSGELAEIQRTTFLIGSGAGRLRLWGRNAVYATVYGQSGLYHDSGFPELDAADLGIDFGYLWQSAGGRSWRVALTEDVRRRDPGVDLTLKLSTSR